MSKIESDKTLYKLLSEPLLVPDYQRDYAQGRVNDLKILDTRVNFVADIIAGIRCCGWSTKTDNMLLVSYIYM